MFHLPLQWQGNDARNRLGPRDLLTWISLSGKAGQKNAVPGIYAGHFLDTWDIAGTFPDEANTDLQRRLA